MALIVLLFAKVKIRIETSSKAQNYHCVLRKILCNAQAKWMASEAQTRNHIPEYNPEDNCQEL